MTTVVALAPAKLNIGLEVIGKRADGFHDIVTVMQTVSIFDRLTFTESETTILHVADPALASDDNLVLRAANRFHRSFPEKLGVTITLEKRIPAAAGLGGASSDAAATIQALSLLLHRDDSDESEAVLAAAIGSDVTFLLTGGTSLVEGRGEAISPLPPLVPTWFVVLTPALAIPRKTAALYGRLQPDDFTSGEFTRSVASAIEQGTLFSADHIHNTFLRPMRELRPEITLYEREFISAGAPFVTLSGAGPSLFTAVSDLSHARAIMNCLRTLVRPVDRVFVCCPVARSPILSSRQDIEREQIGTDHSGQAFER